MENRNKILAGIITFFIMLSLLVGGYFLLYKKSGGKTSTTGKPTITKISDDTVISPVPTFDASGVWYFNANGQLFRRAFDNSSFNEYALPSLVPNFRKTAWPAVGNDFIAVGSSASGAVLNYFNAESKQYKILPTNIKSFDWMPDGKRIVYVWQSTDGKQSQLISANSDTSGYRIIKNLFWPDLTVKVSPDGKQALLVRSVVQEVNQVYLVNLDSGEFSTVVDTGKNLEAEWVSNSKFIYTQSSTTGNDIKFFDLSSKQVMDLNINSSLNKIAIDLQGKYLYADLVSGQADSIWKVDLSNASKQKVYDFDSTIKPYGLFMNDQVICFINTSDGKLYTLSQ